MVKSLFAAASAGSGRTYRLTQEVRAHLDTAGEFTVAATFTRAAAAEKVARKVFWVQETALAKSYRRDYLSRKGIKK
jgi:hypothetical protein